jgi:cellulose synthase/poly-beta-1,6-N-acetylglucosamine synthase-like glycosyltransferase
MLALLLWIISLVAAGAACYLWGWALLGLLGRPRRRPSLLVEEPPRFLVILPAHNEAHRLPALLADLQALSYPADRYQIWVVADNCTDDTVEVASRAGARCLVRTDFERRGKGWALAFAFDEAAKTNADAVVVLDADASAPAALLCGLAHRFAAVPSPRALQVSNRLRPGESAESLLLAAENLLEDRLFYGARARLGVPTLLRGNGMCLSLALLRDHPWQAESLAEDAEYGASLLAAGERPEFVSEVEVSSPAPTRRAQTVVQRTRWGAGHRRAVRHYARRILARGLREGDWRRCDAALAMYLTSKSALLAGSGLSLLLAVLCARVVGTGPAWVSAAAVLALLAYLLLGLFLCRPRPGQAVRALLAAPVSLFVRVWVHAASLRPRAHSSWQRTPD